MVSSSISSFSILRFRAGVRAQRCPVTQPSSSNDQRPLSRSFHRKRRKIRLRESRREETRARATCSRLSRTTKVPRIDLRPRRKAQQKNRQQDRPSHGALDTRYDNRWKTKLTDTLYAPSVSRRNHKQTLGYARFCENAAVRTRSPFRSYTTSCCVHEVRRSFVVTRRRENSGQQFSGDK